MSVNRGKYSRPEHVLCARFPAYLSHQVAQFKVTDIPPTLTSGTGGMFTFAIVHDPVGPPQEPNENYAHSEIRAFVAGVRNDRVPSKVKKEFRQIVSELMRPVPRQGS
jgi:hypothetical protein